MYIRYRSLLLWLTIDLQSNLHVQAEEKDTRGEIAAQRSLLLPWRIMLRILLETGNPCSGLVGVLEMYPMIGYTLRYFPLMDLWSSIVYLSSSPD